MSNAKNKLLEMAPLNYQTSLTGEDWKGAEGDKWRDIAVDSSSTSALVWVRRRMKDDKYFIVISIIKGHILACQISRAEAKELYAEMPCRAPYDKSFKRTKRKKKNNPRKDLTSNNE